MERFEVDLEIVKIQETYVEDVSVEEEQNNIEEEENAGYHLFVKAYLDGEKEISLVVDTGASKSVFDPELLAEYTETQEQKVQSMSVNAELEMGVGCIRSFTLGDIEKKDMLVGLTSLEAINTMYETMFGRKIWGLLGSDFLMEHKAIINYETGTMSLSQY